MEDPNTATDALVPVELSPAPRDSRVLRMRLVGANNSRPVQGEVEERGLFLDHSMTKCRSAKPSNANADPTMPEASIVNLSEEGLLDWVHWGTRGASSGDHDFMASGIHKWGSWCPQRERASNACEYCQLLQEDSPLALLHVEHIILKVHGGTDDLDNLALRSVCR